MKARSLCEVDIPRTFVTLFNLSKTSRNAAGLDY